MRTSTSQRELHTLIDRLIALCTERIDLIVHACPLIYNALGMTSFIVQRHWSSSNCYGLPQYKSRVIGSNVHLDFWIPYVMHERFICTPTLERIFVQNYHIYINERLYRIKYHNSIYEMFEVLYQLGFDIPVIFALTIETHYRKEYTDIDQANQLMQDVQDYFNSL